MAALPAGVEIELVETEAELAPPALRLGELDMAVVEEYEHAPRPRDPAFDREELCRDPLLVALPAGRPLADAPDVALAALSGESWAAPRADTAFADMLVRTCPGRLSNRAKSANLVSGS